ncbi:hypothetical protein D3C81_31970 [compost metagenome]
MCGEKFIEKMTGGILAALTNDTLSNNVKEDPKMKKVALLVCIALTAGVLSACSGFTSVKSADGTQVTRGHIAPGTKITTSTGGCIDSTGGGGCQQLPAQK